MVAEHHDSVSGLIPAPRSVEVHGAVFAPDLTRVEVGLDPASLAWKLVGARDIPAEGYTLRVSIDVPQVTIAAADAAGEFYARQTLAQLGERMPPLIIRDAPALPRRGTIEGFYGEPWTHEQRLDHVRFAGSVKFNTFVYAPKDDPYHRDRWRELYPAAELDRLAQIATVAAENHVDFVYALHPAVTMRFSDDREHELLEAKAAQLLDAGIRSIALLFDDVPPELSDPTDREVFGEDGLGAAHGTTCARFASYLESLGVDEPLLMVPMDYAGLEASPYRVGLAATLPRDAIVWWTGHDIVVGTVSRDDIDRAAGSYGREVLLWDNFPVNDFDRNRYFLGPLTGRTTDVAGAPLVGITANPMVDYAPSKFALAAIADWAWNTAAYDPDSAARRSLALLGAEGIAPLVDALSAWPPSADQSARLSALVERALAGDTAELELALDELAGIDLAVAKRHGLSRATAAGVAMARAGLAALRDSPERAAAALVEAESHDANVLLGVIPPFVREVLTRAGYPVPPPRDRKTPAAVSEHEPTNAP